MYRKNGLLDRLNVKTLIDWDDLSNDEWYMAVKDARLKMHQEMDNRISLMSEILEENSKQFEI